MVRWTRWLLRLANILNWIAVAWIIVVMVGLVVDPAPVARGLAKRFGQHADLVRWSVIGLCASVVVTGYAAHRILTALIAIIDSVLADSPFIRANADRLRTIAWAMLAIQLVDLAAGWDLIHLSTLTGEYFGWSFGIGGWLAVLLLFVLAQVFRQGAEMQADLEGTI